MEDRAPTALESRNVKRLKARCPAKSQAAEAERSLLVQVRLSALTTRCCKKKDTSGGRERSERLN